VLPPVFLATIWFQTSGIIAGSPASPLEMAGNPLVAETRRTIPPLTSICQEKLLGLLTILLLKIP